VDGDTGASGRRLGATPVADAVSPVRVPDDVLVRCLTALAAADSTVDAAGACLPLLHALPGVRATAVVTREGRDVVVQGSAGYDCGVMAPGARLPLDAGLPVTEAVRTGRTVVRGPGPGWVAAPFGTGTATSGGLLLSVDLAPPQEPADLQRLAQLAAGIGAALHRTAARERADHGAADVTMLLLPHDLVSAGVDAAVRQQPFEGAVGGDVVTCLQVGGATWLVSADVCGYGLQAAVVASAVRTAVHTALPHVTGPAALLRAVQRGVRPALRHDAFVTAAAVRLADGVALVATAGHPPPLALGPGGPTVLTVDAAPPLGVLQPDELVAERAWPVADGTVLLLHTDGLTDRRTSAGVRMLPPTALCAGVDTASLQDAADEVVAAADAVAPASDDVSLLLVRVRR
jgi:hypothetical protein